MLAGIAFNAAGCHLPHGLSYAVSGLVKDWHVDGYPAGKPLVPHGMAVVLNNPSVWRHTAPAHPTRHLRCAHALGASIDGRDTGRRRRSACHADHRVDAGDANAERPCRARLRTKRTSTRSPRAPSRNIASSRTRRSTSGAAELRTLFKSLSTARAIRRHVAVKRAGLQPSGSSGDRRGRAPLRRHRPRRRRGRHALPAVARRTCCPCRGSLSISSSAWCRSSTCLTIARPSPVPPVARERLRSTR